MAFKAHTNRNIQMKGNFYTTTLFFSFKNAQVLLKNSPSSIAKCNHAGREKKSVTHTGSFTWSFIPRYMQIYKQLIIFFHMNTQPFRRMQSNLIPETFPCFRFGLKKKKWLNGMAGWSSQSLKTALDLFLRIHSFSLPLEMNLKLPKVGGYSEPGWRDKRGKDRLQF